MAAKETNGAVITYAENVGKQDFRDIPWQIRMEGSESGMNCFYSAHWCMPTPPPEEGAEPKKGAMHPPHMHKENEVIMLIGGDPEDPYDLGATVEMCIGADMQKYTFTRSATIMIPAGTPHGFYRIVECHRPFMFVSTQEAPERTEKFLWEYLPQDVIDAMEHREFWQDKGYE